MTAAEFRELALSFPEAAESSHHAHADFRVGGKIFATLGYPDASCGVVMLSPDDQAFYMKVGGKGLTPVKGEWGRKGSTVVTLRAVKTPMVRDALEAAWRRRAPKRLLKDHPEAY